jgi:mevalonate kinase
MLYKASAPGSLMLLGEYAVLHGKSALVCAINKRMTVTLRPRVDSKINISSALGALNTDIAALEVRVPFQFVLATLKKFQNKFISGCDIEIISEFSDKIGFASSAAVTVAMLAVMNEWLQLAFTSADMARVARTIIREVQGHGSGADAAACVFGGMIAYSAKPFTIEKLPHHYPLTVIYSGSKTSTPDAIAEVKRSFANKESLFRRICEAIGDCTLEGRQAVYAEDWARLGKIMNVQQGLMDALGVNTARLQNIVYTLKEYDHIFGAKISGSGLGDCVIGLGEIPEDSWLDGNNMRRILVNVAEQGVICEKE